MCFNTTASHFDRKLQFVSFSYMFTMKMHIFPPKNSRYHYINVFHKYKDRVDHDLNTSTSELIRHAIYYNPIFC